jgi:hypothetical protein
MKKFLAAAIPKFQTAFPMPRGEHRIAASSGDRFDSRNTQRGAGAVE